MRVRGDIYYFLFVIDMDKNKLLYKLIAVGMALILVAAVLPILQIHWEGSRYMLAVGAAATLVLRLLLKYPKSTTRIARLHRMENVAAMCYCVSAFFLFYPGAGPSDWLGFLTAGAALQIYATFTIDYLEKRDKK